MIRIQLTLFIAENDASVIEKIRSAYNPVQHELINSHVTLCREDELEQIEVVLQNLRTLNMDYIAIDFGPAIRFSNGNGVFIPAIGDNTAFHTLRKQVLQGIIENPRLHEPHITLIHPRNGTCTDEMFEAIQTYTLPSTIQFHKISLIEQEPGMQWKILEEFELKN